MERERDVQVLYDTKYQWLKMFPRLCCSVSPHTIDGVATSPYILNCLGINYRIEMGPHQDLEDTLQFLSIHCSCQGV